MLNILLGLAPAHFAFTRRTFHKNDGMFNDFSLMIAFDHELKADLAADGINLSAFQDLFIEHKES